MADETRPTITYAPPDRSVRRRIRRRAVPILLALFVVSGFWWVPPAWLRVQVLYWQSRCAAYQPSADTIVASRMGPEGARVTSVGNVPAEWVRFYNLLSPPGLISDGTIFLHEMTRPSGERVIVAVDLVKTPYFAPGAAGFQVRAFQPGNTIRLPKQIQDQVNWFLFPSESYHVYAGQIDPNDSSHFTFRAHSQGRISLYDGWVRQHGVDLESSVITPPPPASPGSSASSARPAALPASRPASG